MRHNKRESVAEAGIEPESVTEHDGNELWKLECVSGAESGADGARTDKVAWLLVRLERLPDAVLNSVVALVNRAIAEMDATGLPSVLAGKATGCQG